MKPEEVPAELVEKARPALRDLLATEGVFRPADHPRFDFVARRILAAVVPLGHLALLEEMRAEVQGWRPYDTRDIGDAFLADSVVDLIQDRIDRLTATIEEPT